MSKIDEIMASLEYYPIRSATRREPTESDLTEFEEQLGASLPPDYRQFILKYGQVGFKRVAQFEIQEPCPWGQYDTINSFFGFSSSPNEGIVYQTIDVYAGRIPDETIPIADDPGGNLILLGFDGAVFDRVWFWDKEYREITGQIDAMWADVKAKGVDTSGLDTHAMIWHWERLYPERLQKPAGYSNFYLVADSFLNFLELLHLDPAGDS